MRVEEVAICGSEPGACKLLTALPLVSLIGAVSHILAFVRFFECFFLCCGLSRSLYTHPTECKECCWALLTV